MKTDGRSLNHEALEHIRKVAVARVKAGERPGAVIQSYGFSRTAIYKWLKAEAKGGAEALRSRKATGRPRKLTARQMDQVRRWINGKDPRQHGFDFGLWTRGIVAALIEERLRVRLSIISTGRLLARLGITPQKPRRRAYERDPEAIRKWEREDYPALRARARRRGAAIFFLDEAGVRSDASPGRTWAPRGQTPVVPTSGQRQSINAISAVTPRGDFWWRTFSGRLNASRFLEFLGAFMHRRRIPVFLITDRHPAHIAKVVASYVQQCRGRLELHFLPGYAPDLNPDEFVWNHIKTHGLSKRPLKRNESLRARVEQDLSAIAHNPGLVRSFFHAPSVAYIMD
jgi:transposase